MSSPSPATGLWPETRSTFTVGGGALTAVLLADRGGKIASLRTADGHEWLAQPREVLPAPSRHGAVFTEAEMCGWDECAPTIDACSWAGRAVPDHGDLWSADWQVLAATATAVTMRATGSSLNYALERTVTATPRGIRLDYAATTTDDTVPFLWAAHPQFAAPEGARVRLLGVREVVDVAEPTTRLAWSDDLASLRGTGSSRKLYVAPNERVSSAALVLASGRELRLSWSSACSYLGLWFDNAAYSRESVIAIEPSTGYLDSLERAAAAGLVAKINRERPLTWSLAIETA